MTTAIACSPFVFTKLLDFVGLYGLLLMPVGAIVFVEHWIFPKIGLTQFWVSHKKLLLSWPALLSWGIAIAVALTLERAGILHLFFLFVPVWLLTAVLYIIFASMAGAREGPRLAGTKFEDEPAKEIPEKAESEPTASKSDVDVPAAQKIENSKDAVLWISRVVTVVSLLMCLILPIWVYVTAGRQYEQNFATFKNILIWPTLIYFVAGTIWAIKRDKAK